MLRPFLIALVAFTLAGCDRGKQSASHPGVMQVSAELEATKQKLAETEESLEQKKDELSLSAATIQKMKQEAVAHDQMITQKDAELRALQLEAENLKKRDGLVFAEIRTLQQQGQTAAALGRYQQFLKMYPGSPLTADVTTAVSELTAELSTVSATEARRRADLIDPNRDRELVRRFNDGFATPEELAPLLKKKSRAKVLTLLGQPNQTFNDGSELGYADKALSSATGKKGMLIMSFESGMLSALRVDYAGRKVIP